MKILTVQEEDDNLYIVIVKDKSKDGYSKAETVKSQQAPQPRILPVNLGRVQNIKLNLCNYNFTLIYKPDKEKHTTR